MFDENYRLTRRRLGAIEIKYLQDRMMGLARVGANATELAAAAVEYFANYHWASDGHPLFEAQALPEYHFGFHSLSQVEANNAYQSILAAQRTQPTLARTPQVHTNARLTDSFRFNDLLRRHY